MPLDGGADGGAGEDRVLEVDGALVDTHGRLEPGEQDAVALQRVADAGERAERQDAGQHGRVADADVLAGKLTLKRAAGLAIVDLGVEIHVSPIHIVVEVEPAQHRARIAGAGGDRAGAIGGGLHFKRQRPAGGECAVHG